MSGVLSRLLLADLASRAAAVSLVANFCLMLIKLVIGVISGSVAVLSDGIDSGLDLLATGIVYASVQIGRQPPDKDHPFGHGRAETVAAAFQGAVIGGGAAFIAFTAIGRLQDPPDSIGTGLGLASMVLVASVNLLAVRYVTNAARLTRSPAIDSEAKHLWTNVVQAAGVFSGLALVEVSGEVAFDALVALVISAYLFWMAGRVLWGVTADILDSSLPQDDIHFIEDVIHTQDEKISGFHRLRTRLSGQNPHIDLHLTFADSTSIQEAHAVILAIEEGIRERWPKAEVIIRGEPTSRAEVEP